MAGPSAGCRRHDRLAQRVGDQSAWTCSAIGGHDSAFQVPVWSGAV